MKLTSFQKDVLNAKICPYCKSSVLNVPQSYIYGKTYNKKRRLICCKNWPKCDAYVGTDDDGIALGRLADKTLRQFKIRAHEHFDKLWKEYDYERDDLYEELSEYLNIPRKYTHIGMFNPETCKKVIDWSIDKLSIIIKNS